MKTALTGKQIACVLRVRAWEEKRFYDVETPGSDVYIAVGDALERAADAFERFDEEPHNFTVAADKIKRGQHPW